VHAPRPRQSQRGQSLAEFAISSVVLVLLFGGLVDLTRSIHYRDVLAGAARDGARRGASFSAASSTYPYLDDADIKSEVDAELAAGGLPASIANLTTNCPSVTDGNSLHNPPYTFPAAVQNNGNQPYLYICYDNTAAEDHPTASGLTGLTGNDLDVILLMAYSPLTGVIPAALPGGFGLSANWHLWVRSPSS
jgi:Flp pilus assembly protein TadG